MLRAAGTHADLMPQLYVTGSHLLPRFGHTIDRILDAGWEPAATIGTDDLDDTPVSYARTSAEMLRGLAHCWDGDRPDWVVVAGDRYEMLAAAHAATLLRLPIAHVGGGETDVSTNYDCNLRNAMTKLAHVHFVAHELAAERVLAMGEQPWRVVRVGLPSLDDVDVRTAPRDALEQSGVVSPHDRFILASFFPETVASDSASRSLDALLSALSHMTSHRIVYVMSNADAGGDAFDRRVREWARGRECVTLVPSLSPSHYLAALAHCDCYIGNSSSGLIETPLFGTPAVIVGTRQLGRPVPDNARTWTDDEAGRLHDLIHEQIEHGPYRGVSNPYGEGRASQRICQSLRTLSHRDDLLLKRLECGELIT
jgi:UDP-hydrolysing UDP-N-acetyl-D-glucosamine 2-epimerase